MTERDLMRLFEEYDGEISMSDFAPDELEEMLGCKPEELSTDYSKVIPMGRDGKLDEVGDLVAYLVSDRASYIAGTTINISGGKSRG